MQDEHVMTVESYQDYEPVLPGGMPTSEAKLGARFSRRGKAALLNGERRSAACCPRSARREFAIQWNAE